MKIAAFILSFYFLGLNFLGCADEAETSCSDAEVCTKTSVEGESQQDSPEDLCPPFCHCHCCHVHIVDLQTTYFFIFSPEISTLISTRLEAPEKDFSSSLLQPPRI
ncbi:DUF6660 family protein [Salegentibacter sp. F188]|uniref:DUF6660 family protein n=1 Tax=Autumnicola patrickiae TaxID=3075591 RepID=A0ABU3E6W9_9FLAO|nr:DUF6660 family protein [Salegentibacter sp. F188]MDT0690972.1 DUF6660 family protein [Salegentibacter sp. F188]